jgi:hypothetical protein
MLIGLATVALIILAGLGITAGCVGAYSYLTRRRDEPQDDYVLGGEAFIGTSQRDGFYLFPVPPTGGLVGDDGAASLISDNAQAGGLPAALVEAEARQSRALYVVK